MVDLTEKLRRLEESLTTVLIEGESGTGKELVARALHRRSRVADGRFVAINCGALDRFLIRSELFGHKKGAFTGALNEHTGAFEAACGGTLFLDEIGELPYEIQPTLLRVLETRTVCKLGDTAERPVTGRVIAATNRNLSLEVGARQFREDLYFRLSVVRVRVPALAERREDIEPLVQCFAMELGLAPLSGEVMDELLTRAWPGNVRELKNAIQSYAIFGSLPAPVQRNTNITQLPALRPGMERNDTPDMGYTIDINRTYSEEKDRMTRWLQSVYFQRALAMTKGNKSKAARLAGIERSYFSKVLRRMDVE
jgi:DNA-binding NtrC family response regulator